MNGWMVSGVVVLRMRNFNFVEEIILFVILLQVDKSQTCAENLNKI
jgi:hypothetical protein